MEGHMTAADRASDHATGPLGAPSAPGPGLRWCRVFPGEARQLGLVRHWLASLLPDCPARDDVASVATELGSNAVRHTASGRGGCFAVEIAWHQSVVRVSVTDGGSSSVPRLVDDPSGEHGRGLLVVQALSTRTGVCGDHCSRLIWADVPWDGAVAANPASAQDHGASSMCEPPAIGRSGGRFSAPRLDRLAPVVLAQAPPQPPAPGQHGSARSLGRRPRDAVPRPGRPEPAMSDLP